MKLGLGCDHAGFELKQHLHDFLQEKGCEIIDYGTSSAAHSVDYPNIAQELCAGLLSGKFDKGILICGSGVGISIAANRFKGIRAALCSDLLTAKLTREHNDANVLCLGNWLVTKKLGEEIVNVWLNTKFEEGRHKKRVDMLG